MTPEDLSHYFDTNHPATHLEQLSRLRNAWEPLYWQAVRARELAQKADSQWRNFYVGCAVLAYRSDVPLLDGGYRVFYGMNTKLEENARPVCAEPIAINAAYTSGYTDIIGMTVVGEPQQDHGSGLHTPTLHPCHHCRLLMRRHPIIKWRTRIVTAHPPKAGTEGSEEVLWELHTLRRLLRLHGEI